MVKRGFRLDKTTGRLTDKAARNPVTAQETLVLKKQ
jgi:hypothetical protein